MRAPMSNVYRTHGVQAAPLSSASHQKRWLQYSMIPSSVGFMRGSRGVEVLAARWGSSGYGRQRHSQHRDQAKRDMDRDLHQTPNPIQHQTLLSTVEKPLDDPSLPEQLHDPLSSLSHEVTANLESVHNPRISTDRNHRLSTKPLSSVTHVHAAVLSVR